MKFMVFWTPPLAHDFIRPLHRSINAVGRHEVMLGLGDVVLQAAFVKTGGSCVVIVVHRGFLKPPDTPWHSGLLWLPIPCMGGAVFGKHNSRNCAGRSRSFAFILTSLHTVESHQHGRGRPVSRALVSLSSLVITTTSCQSLYSLLTSTTHSPPARGNSSSSAPAPTRTIPPTETKQLTKCKDEAVEVTNRTLSASPEPGSRQSSNTNRKVWHAKCTSKLRTCMLGHVSWKVIWRHHAPSVSSWSCVSCTDIGSPSGWRRDQPPGDGPAWARFSQLDQRFYHARKSQLLPSWRTRRARQPRVCFGLDAVSRESCPTIESNLLCVWNISAEHVVGMDKCFDTKDKLSAITSEIDSFAQFLLWVPLSNSLGDCFTSELCAQNPPQAL